MNAGKRIRLGRPPTIVLRQTVEASYAIETHQSPSMQIPENPGRVEGLFFEYDDGNGLWISNGETPSDQG